MGSVYRGYDPVINREVAIKTINPVRFSPDAEEGYRRRFLEEAQAAGRLSHPGIVTIYDAGVDQSQRTPYIVMQLVEGHSLQRAVEAAGKPLEPAAAIDIAIQIAAALEYAHACGVVHRDVKPANVSLTPEGRAVLTDFGIAQFRRSRDAVAREEVGTLAFMAPERIQGRRADGRADLFSLGVILYWLLTGEKPFTGDDKEVMFKLVFREPVPASTRNPALGPAADAVLSRALAKTPEERYQTGSQFVDDLRRLLATPALPAAVPPPGEALSVPAPPARRALGRVRGILLLCGAIAMLALLLAWIAKGQ